MTSLSLDVAEEILPGPGPKTEDHRIVSCIICGAEGFILDSRRFPDLVRCPGCSLRFLDPQPTDKELAAIYDANYFRTFGYNSTNQSAFRRMKQAWFRRLLRLCSGLLERWKCDSEQGRFGSCRLLDVGSGLGDLLVTARTEGWDARGVEPNPAAITEADRVIPGATFQGTLTELPEDARLFELVVCTDVLEHLRRPDLELRRMRSLLRSGGVLAITTIDSGSWLAKVCGSHWPHFHRDHLWYFDRASLSRLVEQAGFEVLLHTTPKKIFNLRYLFGILECHLRGRIVKWAAGAALRRFPGRFLDTLLPGIAEGQFIIARSDSDVHSTNTTPTCKD